MSKNKGKYEEVLKMDLVRHTYRDSIQIDIISIESILGELSNEELCEYTFERLTRNEVQTKRNKLAKYNDHLYEYIEIHLVNNYKKNQCEFLIGAPKIEINGYTYVNDKCYVKDYCNLISVPSKDAISDILTMIYYGVFSYNNLDVKSMYTPIEKTDNHMEWIDTFVDLYFNKDSFDIVFRDAFSSLNDTVKYRKLKEIQSTLETVYWYGSEFIAKNTQKAIKISFEFTDRSIFEDGVFKSFHEINSPVVYIDGSTIASSPWIKVFNNVYPMNANTNIKVIKETSMYEAFKSLINDFLDLLK